MQKANEKTSEKTKPSVKKNKDKIKPIKKPYLTGRPFGRQVFSRLWRVVGLYVLFVFLYLILGTALTFGNTVLRVSVNVLLFLAMCALTYMEGLRNGDADVAFAEIAYTRRENGKNVDEEDLQKCFHPLKGFVTAILGALPFLLCALVYALIVHKQTYQLQSLPSWVGSYSTAEDIMLPLSYYQREVSLGLEGVLRIVVRLMIYPFVNMVGASNINGMYLMDRISPLIVLIPALTYGFGYLYGPSSRALTHGSIASNRRKQKRRQRRERKARQKQGNELI